MSSATLFRVLRELRHVDQHNHRTAETPSKQYNRTAEIKKGSLLLHGEATALVLKLPDIIRILDASILKLLLIQLQPMLAAPSRRLAMPRPLLDRAKDQSTRVVLLLQYFVEERRFLAEVVVALAFRHVVLACFFEERAAVLTGAVLDLVVVVFAGLEHEFVTRVLDTELAGCEVVCDRWRCLEVTRA